ncbi:hypothetical protein HMPREF1250_1513 [Megasphaera vaginalis (ex Srinivasan et al. 2021)]|uniref:Uncharacterized protein n=1 Tax=Megasphaera vaginalis (ex Srinivasan et al. 2021) TaxID=1111454 RepID=U7UDK7_9FIRM|nr:hypothetical protein HMPREF1250_1513 [Megasphaera vaginalis (ex Srinivasan et al. 2021)]
MTGFINRWTKMPYKKKAQVAGAALRAYCERRKVWGYKE